MLRAFELLLLRDAGFLPDLTVDGVRLLPLTPDQPYRLTLPPYGFYWFILSDQQALPSWQASTLRASPGTGATP